MPIMNQVKKLTLLENLSYFDKVTLQQHYNLSNNSLYANIKRWLRSGHLIQLKKGLYVTSMFYQALPEKQAYYEFIANKLREPSYLSMEYVLQKYSILTEMVSAITSVTLKLRRTYSNRFGTFIYRNLKEDIFTGFNIMTRDRFDIKEATKAKALFDYLYLKTFKLKSINDEFLDSLRLNLGEFSKEDLSELSYYCKLGGAKKFLVLPELVERAHGR